jgi:acyl-CoA dehydrogenase
MRWLGLARRAIEIAVDWVEHRRSGGAPLADREGVRWLLADAAAQVHAGRLLVMHAAWKLDQGDFARKEVSMAKLHVSETLHKAVDTAIQLCGARGYSKDTPLEWMYRYARQARLVDGASEVHRGVIANLLLQERDGFWDRGIAPAPGRRPGDEAAR